MFGREPRKGNVWHVLGEHFGQLPPESIVTAIRRFPIRLRADLQRALESLFHEQAASVRTFGLHRQHNYGMMSFSDLFERGHGAVRVGPLRHEEVDIGEPDPVRCLEDTLWLVNREGVPHTVMLTKENNYGQIEGMTVEIASPAGEAAERLSREYFSILETEIAKAKSYRGKVLSLEAGHAYTGQSTGILVHKLRSVGADDIILPEVTRELLKRNVFGFIEQRQKLAQMDLPLKKGLLFYGPPGTGKTHSIHYLASALPGHTTLLITAEQMGLLKEYMALARLLQPSIVVIEDADMIAQDRNNPQACGTEVILNQLLNEMDGLRADSETMFILTTNRPNLLEPALAARPGRIDQAIEFPLPDEDGRRRLAQLYGAGLKVAEPLLEEIVRRTDRASPAFIKELMRRTAQFALERADNGFASREDVEEALDEMLIKGGQLNTRLLGGYTE